MNVIGAVPVHFSVNAIPKVVIAQRMKMGLSQCMGVSTGSLASYAFDYAFPLRDHIRSVEETATIRET